MLGIKGWLRLPMKLHKTKLWKIDSDELDPSLGWGWFEDPQPLDLKQSSQKSQRQVWYI